MVQCKSSAAQMSLRDLKVSDFRNLSSTLTSLYWPIWILVRNAISMRKTRSQDSCEYLKIFFTSVLEI